MGGRKSIEDASIRCEALGAGRRHHDLGSERVGVVYDIGAVHVVLPFEGFGCDRCWDCTGGTAPGGSVRGKH